MKKLLRFLTLSGCLPGLLISAKLDDAKPHKVSFPGAKSPDGRFIIRNVDDEKLDPAHTLTLVDASNGSAVKSYSYGRHVDVLWSPSSDAFVVNDYEGSDASRPVLFMSPWKGQPVDLRKKLTDFLRSQGEARSVDGNHHVYFSAKRWLGRDVILCQVTGYGDVDPKGFTKRYVYKLCDGFHHSRH